MTQRESNRVLIFDTTLRDGEQSPGASMGLADKVTMAHALAELGVDVIEAGFPAASDGDFAAVRAVASSVQGPVIAGLSRALEGDIQRTHQALKGAGQSRIHLFLATSPLHREYKLKMSKEKVLAQAVAGVSLAADLCHEVEFSPEDAVRTEPAFLAEVIEAVIEAGATTVNIPDTVGYAVPELYAGLIGYLKTKVSNIDRAVISVHCHNDLGLAVANSLAALRAGARQVECTINGIGERAGNCSLEEVVMALRTRTDYYGFDTGIQTPQLYPTSKLLSAITGLEVQRNKAIVGPNAFAHEAGIHQHGVLMNSETYEIIRPEDVGVARNELVLGKHSGRHALADWLDRRGYEMSESQFQTFFVAFKKLADAHKVVTDNDLEMLVLGTEAEPAWRLLSFQANTGVDGLANAAVCLKYRQSEEKRIEAACGTSPLEALFQAIARASGFPIDVSHYNVRNRRWAGKAISEVTLSAILAGHLQTVHAVHADALQAGSQAMLQLVNMAERGSQEETLSQAAAI